MRIYEWIWKKHGRLLSTSGKEYWWRNYQEHLNNYNLFRHLKEEWASQILELILRSKQKDQEINELNDALRVIEKLFEKEQMELTDEIKKMEARIVQLPFKNE